MPAVVIGFGASLTDSARATLPQAGQTFKRDHGEVHFLYTGASGPVMPHSLNVLFDGLRLYREKYPERAGRLRFHFVGTSYVAPGQGKPSVLPVAVDCGVEEQVDEIPHRIGHLEALRWQQAADVLLLPGSSDLAYSPSKIYPYFLSDRPILGLVFRDSVMEGILDELSCAVMVRFREQESKSDAHAQLHAFFDLALTGFPPGLMPSRNTEHFERHYLAEELTRRQTEFFNRAVTSQLTIT